MAVAVTGASATHNVKDINPRVLDSSQYVDDGRENLTKRFGDFENTREDNLKLAFLICFPVLGFLIAVIVTSQYV